jgi:lysozyme
MDKISPLSTIAAILLVTTATRSAVSGQDAAQTWKVLTDEPSRAELFRDYAKNRIRHPGVGKFSFVFPSVFQFPGDAIRDMNGALRSDSLFGLDISHHDGKEFQVSTLRQQQVAFIYVKATQGTDFADPEFGSTWTRLAVLPDGQRIPRGAFHFLSSFSSQSGTAQADRFLAYVQLHGGFKPGDLPPAMDLEWDRLHTNQDDRWTTNHRTAAEIVSTSRDFLNRIKAKTGRTPLIYTNKSFLSDHGITSDAQIAELTDGFKVWIFDLSTSDRKLELPDPKKNLRHSLWQFSWEGLLSDGHTGNLDVDYFKGDIVAFKAAFLEGP